MKELKGSKNRKKILLTAFAGESQARNRYDFFAKQAKKDGYEQISGVFTETALNEKEHAKRLFKFLEGGEVEITAAYPAGKIGTTVENLTESAAGEHYEHTIMYPEFAQIADEEGFEKIAVAFRHIGKAELQHERRYLGLLKNIENGTVFKKDKVVKWKCRNCGYVHEGTKTTGKVPCLCTSESIL